MQGYSIHSLQRGKSVKTKTQVAVVTAAIAVATSLHATVARAESPESAYENGARLTSTLDPGEYLANVDGAKEDPNRPMTDVARAYRNGLINGKAIQKQADAKERQANLPPLPPDLQGDQRVAATPARAPEFAPRPLSTQPRYTQYESPPPSATTYASSDVPDDAPPAYAQPRYERPAYAPPAYQQPAYQQPVYQQPAYAQPAYQQPVYVEPAYAPPPPPPPLVQYVPVYSQPAYVPVQPAVIVATPIAYPVYRGGGWGYRARGYGYGGWR
jgi:hypothetical protein